MAQAKEWKKRRTSNSTYVEVNLSDFDTDQLLQALIDDGMLSEAEALAIINRGSSDAAVSSVVVADPDHIDDAWNELIRGRKKEALHHIERALGNQWLGRLS